MFHKSVSFGLVFLCLGFSGCKEANKMEGNQEKSEMTEESANKELAKIAAHMIVLKNLKAPSTAQFESIDIIDQKNLKYFVHILVDAQNSYGAMLRSSRCVVVELSAEKKGEFIHKSGVSEGECSDPPTPEEIQKFKGDNDWGN